MNENETRQLIKQARAATADEAETLRAALEILDTLAKRSNAGRTRSQLKTITAARHAAEGIRTILANRYGIDA